MSLTRAKTHLAAYGREGDVMEFAQSSATVELAAQAVGCEPARIAKTLSFEAGERVALVVCVGGVCPFGVNEGCDVFLDESLRRFDTVYPACGTASSAIAVTPDDLAALTPDSTWVDVCKLPE